MQGRTGADEQEHPTARTDTDQTLIRPVGGSSRDSLAGAGWTCSEAGKFRGLVSPRRKFFSWLSLVPLWRSRNQILGSLLGDPTNDERRRWMDIQHKAGKLQPNLVIEEHADLEEFSFFVVGDTGEGDASQFAVGNRARRGCGIHGRTARDRARAGGKPQRVRQQAGPAHRRADLAATRSWQGSSAPLLLRTIRLERSATLQELPPNRRSRERAQHLLLRCNGLPGSRKEPPLGGRGQDLSRTSACWVGRKAGKA